MQLAMQWAARQLCSVHYALCTVFCTLFCTVCGVQCAVLSMLCALCSARRPPGTRCGRLPAGRPPREWPARELEFNLDAS